MSNLISDIRALPRSIRGLLASVFLSRTGTFASMFLVLYLTDVFHLTHGEASRVMAWFGAGSILATLIGGVATDRWGSRRVLVSGYLGHSLAIILLLFQTALAPLYIAIFLCGFTIDLVRPASTTLIAHTLSGAARVKTFSLHHIMMNLGWILGPMIGSALVGIGFRPLFSWNAVIAVGCGLIVWRMVSDPPQRHETEKEWGAGDDVAIQFRLVPFLLALGCEFFLGALMVQSTISLPLYVRDILHLPTWCYGTVVSVNGLGVVLLGYPIATLMNRYPSFLGTGCGLFIYGLGTASYGLASTLPGLLGAEMILTIGEVMSVAVFYNLVAQLSPPRMRGKLFGLTHAVMGTSMLVTPILIGLLLERVAFTTFWALTGFIGSGALLFALVGHRLTALPPAAREPIELPGIEPSAS